MRRPATRPRLRLPPVPCPPAGRTPNLLPAGPPRAVRRLGPADHLLVRQFTPLARHLAWRFARRRAPDLPADELIAEALFGLTYAASVYDEAREVPFGAFATLVIRHRLTHRTRSWRRDRRLSTTRRRPADLTDNDDEVWDELREVEDRRPPKPWSSTAAAGEACERVRRVLPARSYAVLYQYHAEGCTLREIGERLGLTRERVRQIINKAIDLAREQLTDGDG